MESSDINLKGRGTTSGSIILFDGVCNLCNGMVNFVADRDPDLHFKMASLQSKTGQQILERLEMPKEHFETIILVENGTAFTHSSSILRILKKLTGLWPLLSVFLLVPPPIRDGIYKWVSSNRYRWFGKQETCRVPEPGMEQRFLE